MSKLALTLTLIPTSPRLLVQKGFDTTGLEFIGLLNRFAANHIILN
jgi:hypothetical protein